MDDDVVSESGRRDSEGEKDRDGSHWELLTG
jgi:hypothetical protein